MRLAFAIAVVATIAAAMIAGTTAMAGSLQVEHKPWKQLTNQQKIHVLHKQLVKDHSVIRFWHNHRLLATIHRYNAAIQIHWATTSIKVVKKSLARLVVPATQVVGNSGVVAALMCIHSHEGSWTDPGYPYWGGLQMDINFMKAYGPEFYDKYGTADHWPVADQLVAGERGVAARGYAPWPNTAAMCGLS